MAGKHNNERKPKPGLGFLTVLEHPQDGLFGGYLVLDFRGRPLEFRCTAPIKPNRAQQILYGATLKHYLYGEQIGQTLLDGSKHTPLMVCVNLADALAVRDCVDVPVALVEPPTGEPSPAESDTPEPASAANDPNAKEWFVHTAHSPEVALNHFHWGHNRLATWAQREDDQAVIVERLSPLADSFDLAEPFVRIREAIEEARRAGG